MLLAELDDVLAERLKVARGGRGVSRALEDPHGAGVGSAIGLLEDLVGHSLVDRDRVDGVGGLASLGEPQPQVAAELLLCGGLRGVPREIRRSQA